MWPSSPAEGEPTKPFILNLVFAAPELPPDGHRFLFVLSSPGFSGSGGWGEGTLRDGFLVFLLRMPGVHFLGLCCSWWWVNTIFSIKVHWYDGAGRLLGSAYESHSPFSSSFFFHLCTTRGSPSLCLPRSSFPPLSLLHHLFSKPICRLWHHLIISCRWWPLGLWRWLQCHGTWVNVQLPW